MKLNIEVPDETWAVSLTVIATHRGDTDTSCAICTIIDPEDELEISWDKEDPSVLKDVVTKKRMEEERA